jgi:hypothetical protein
MAVNTEEYQSILKQLEDLKNGVADTIKAEVNKAVAIEKANSANALKIAQLEHEKKEASNVSEISHLKSEVATYKAQAEIFKNQLDEQRKATVEVAKAGQIGTMNVGTGSQSGR